MIWSLSDTIMKRVIRDAPLQVASSSSVIKSELGCFMLWAWAVNIHPWPLFYEASLS